MNSPYIIPGIYSLFWGSTAVRQDISTDVFIIQGPQYSVTRFTCIVGYLCEVDLIGVGLQNINRLKIIASDSPLIANSNSSSYEVDDMNSSAPFWLNNSQIEK